MNILLDSCYPIISLDNKRTEEIFSEFLRNGFSYDALSSRPDSLTACSAYTLSIFLPQIIKAMLDRNDDINYIIYGIMTAIDPETWDDELNQRTQKLKSAFDSNTVALICELIGRIESDPPFKHERLDRIKKYWGCCS